MAAMMLYHPDDTLNKFNLSHPALQATWAWALGCHLAMSPSPIFNLPIPKTDKRAPLLVEDPRRARSSLTLCDPQRRHCRCATAYRITDPGKVCLTGNELETRVSQSLAAS